MQSKFCINRSFVPEVFFHRAAFSVVKACRMVSCKASVLAPALAPCWWTKGKRKIIKITLEIRSDSEKKSFPNVLYPLRYSTCDMHALSRPAQPIYLFCFKTLTCQDVFIALFNTVFSQPPL